MQFCLNLETCYLLKSQEHFLEELKDQLISLGLKVEIINKTPYTYQADHLTAIFVLNRKPTHQLEKKIQQAVRNSGLTTITEIYWTRSIPIK